MIKAAHVIMKNVRLHACQSTEPPYLNFQDMTFEQSDKIKYLGVTLDKNLNFKPHVKKLKTKTLSENLKLWTTS